MNFQIQILQYLESVRTDFLTAIMVSITMMAESLFLVSILAILYWCVDKVKSIRLAFIVLFSSVINGVIKTIVQMPRPFEKGVIIPLRVETATSSSFPSGHTQSATSFWGGSSFILKSRLSLVMAAFMVGLTA
ncbi:MAG: phosphoesterase PA-phosphatase related protein, partial [Clostridia bacterium]|nr:phosphoesterase PA-phosphatase related protein [Clostridia bacterium]